ncbi:MAG: hypothetical protein ACK44A_03975 [Roseateles sp.]
MHAICRWLLIGLLIVSLPLKGLAAAGHLGCGHLHALSAGLSATAMSGDQAMHGEDCAHAGSPGASAAKSAAPEPMKCTHCAPCTGAVAPSADVAVVLVGAGAASPKVAVRQLDLGDGSDRLERPPRSSAV